MNGVIELADAAEKLTRSVEDLRCFQLAYRLSLHVHRMSLALPKQEQYELASQLRRSSKGVCANLTEGFAKQQFSKAEFKRYLAIAIGSATETKLWIRYCADLDYVSAQHREELQTEYELLLKMLQKLHGTIG